MRDLTLSDKVYTYLGYIPNTLIRYRGVWGSLNEYIQAVVNALNYPPNVALRDSGVYAWAPKAPMHLYRRTDDDQVPYCNSIAARDSILARGAEDVRARDVKSNANYSQCAQPAIDSALAFFLTYRCIGLVAPTWRATCSRLYYIPTLLLNLCGCTLCPAQGTWKFSEPTGVCIILKMWILTEIMPSIYLHFIMACIGCVSFQKSRCGRLRYC